MDIIAHNGKRPIVVKFALILLAFNTGDALVMSVIYAQWDNLSADISFGGFLILYVIPLWFVFHRKNWARWFVAVLTFGGVCYSPFLWVRDHQTFSAFYTVWFWLSNLLDVITLILLFHPSSNRWFQAKLSTELRDDKTDSL
jgi:hypothetical protein